MKSIVEFAVLTQSIYAQVSSATIIGTTIWEYEYVRGQVKRMMDSSVTFFQQRQKHVSFKNILKKSLFA